MSWPIRSLALGAGVAFAALAGQAQAQAAPPHEAAAAIDIQDGVQISTLQRLTLKTEGVQALSPSATAMIDAIAVIQVSGDPGRAYRIRLPLLVTAEGRVLVDELTARGAGGADATGQHATIDTGGHDVIRLQGRLRVSPDSDGGSAAMPLSVDVE